MLKFGDKVTAPRSMRLEQPVTGIVVGFDEDDVHGWVYDVASEDDGSWWTHKDETVLVTDPRDERIAYLESGLANLQTTIARGEEGRRADAAAAEESIAQLTIELANTQAQMERHKALAKHWEGVYESACKAGDFNNEALRKAQATITALKALVISVTDASAAKEAVWFATEAYNAKAEKARGTLAALKAQEGTLSWYSPERGE